ncbi:Phage coiled coil domain protein [Burkholderia latens]
MTTTTELTVIERAAVALGTSERETELRALVAKSTDIVEIKNAAGRDQCHAAAMLLRTARTSIRKVGKDARDDATKFSKAVIAEEDRLVALIEPEETRLLGMRDAWDEAREAEKRAKLEAEQRRVAAIREHIDDIRAIAVRAVGMPAARIQGEIEDLEALGITLDRFAELTGEAEAVRGATLDKLRELHAAAIAHEAEQARLAAEREALERERAALAEQQRQEAEARAEQERVDRERREAEEAARRAQQEREDAERCAAMAAEEARLAEQRAEQERRQAELDRAEREQREREEAALREAAESTAQAERDRVARQRAENRAAMLAPEPTGGNWTAKSGCVVTDVPIPGCVGGGFDDVEHYGGYLIAESIFRPADGHVLAASRAMFDALRQWQHAERVGDAEELANARAARDAAIEKATYVHTEETAAA